MGYKKSLTGILAGAVISLGSLSYSGNSNAEDAMKMDSNCMSGVAISYEDLLVNKGNDKEELVLTSMLDKKNAQIYFTKNWEPYEGRGKNARLLNYLIHANTGFAVFDSSGERYVAIMNPANTKDISGIKICKLEGNTGIFDYNDRKYKINLKGKIKSYNVISEEEAGEAKAEGSEDEKGNIKDEGDKNVNIVNGVETSDIKVADTAKENVKSAFDRVKTENYEQYKTIGDEQSAPQENKEEEKTLANKKEEKTETKAPDIPKTDLTKVRIPITNGKKKDVIIAATNESKENRTPKNENKKIVPINRLAKVLDAGYARHPLTMDAEVTHDAGYAEPVKVAERNYSTLQEDSNNDISPVLDDEAPGCNLINFLRGFFSTKEDVTVVESQDTGVVGVADYVVDAGVDSGFDAGAEPALEAIAKECKVAGLTNYFTPQRKNYIINEMYKGDKVLKYFKGDFAFSGVIKNGRFTKINVSSNKTTLEKGRKIKLEGILSKLENLPAPEKNQDCSFDEIILRF